MPSTRSILENVFGMLGIVFWSFQLLPQVVDNYKAKSTEGLSYSMFFIWTLAALGFGSYGIVEQLSYPIIIQPQIFGALSTVCYLQCLYYGQRTRWSLKWTMIAAVFFFVAMAGIQAGAVFATRAGKDHDVKGTIDAAGIIPIILLAIGFMPQYFDIYRDRSVVGVSMPFIAADAAGACFSLISLAFREEFDLLAALNYVVVLICDLIVVVFYVYFNKLHPELARVREVSMDEEKAANAATEVGEPPFRFEEAQSTSTTIVGTEEDLKASPLGQEEQQHQQQHHHSLGAFLRNGTTIPNHIHATPVLPKVEHPPSA
ncbi:hypothetical protein EMPS_08567 [Entomortierella parvispora]|uniref:PQ-loop-domain-containing protein n=1 Tax=Entomortierella parvispora TaxID=205924 RepID=A0A9P3LZI1_9FUNG|nr:hypothetical protein EMPS_08567 [Entomortierella parvispora]